MDADAVNVEQAMGEPRPRQLRYAAPPHWTRRASTRRYALLLATVLIGMSGWWWAPALVHRVRVWYWQNQCLDRRLAAATVVYADADEQSGGISVTDSAWGSLAGLYYPGGAAPKPTLFVHERQAPGGPPRLVVVELISVRSLGSSRAIDVAARVFRPGRWGNLRELNVTGGVSYGRALALDVSPLRIYAGQPDAADPSHFTIKWHQGSRVHLLHGWLNEDDSVVIESEK
jgi:hypothetical protein